VTDWIADAHKKNRGLEIGTINPNMISLAFAAQSSNWGAMAKLYMRRVITVTHRFIEAALCRVCPNDRARAHLRAAIIDPIRERYDLAVDQVMMLVAVEQKQRPYTLNPKFADAILQARGGRVAELLRPKARLDTKQYGEVQHMVNLDDIARAVQGKSNAEQAREEIHDILKAYYNLSLDRFLDNVFQLGVNYQLLHGPKSPLAVFSQQWVLELDARQLEHIVGETKAAKGSRRKLEKKIVDLNDALETLKI
jgi:hypothetical protein